jgi:hypothetical protein
VWEQRVGDLGRNQLEQAWFPGVHSNVGGGYPDSSLSDITLQWMVERVTARCGLHVDRAYLEAITNPSPTGHLYDSMNFGYKLLGEFERQIDARAADNAARGVYTWEYVHESARLRRDATAALPSRYQPGNLTTYLTRTNAQPLVAASLPEQLPT